MPIANSLTDEPSRSTPKEDHSSAVPTTWIANNTNGFGRASTPEQALLELSTYLGDSDHTVTMVEFRGDCESLSPSRVAVETELRRFTLELSSDTITTLSTRYTDLRMAASTAILEDRSDPATLAEKAESYIESEHPNATVQRLATQYPDAVIPVREDKVGVKGINRVRAMKLDGVSVAGGLLRHIPSRSHDEYFFRVVTPDN